MTKQLAALLALAALLLLPAPGAGAEEASGEGSNRYRFTRQATYFFVDFLGGDSAETLGIETDAEFGIGPLKGRHIGYVEVADYPRTIPGKATNPAPSPDATEEATGITDLITGVWFSSKKHHGPLEVGLGPVFQLPTASDETLGTGKWSAGPGIDIEYRKGRLFLGTIIFHIWSFAGEDDRKDVNMSMAKYFVMYDLNKDWKLVSIPYGVTYYWNKPDDEALSLPVGGGFQRNFSIGSQDGSLHLQYFNYVVRPSKGSEQEVRMTLEWYF
jgi:hypothetical protein